MANRPTGGDRLINRRTVLQAGAAMAAGGTGAAARRACRSAAAPANDHRLPGPRLCGEYPAAAVVQGAKLAPARHGRRDGGGDGQGRRRRRDLRLAVFDVPVRRQLRRGSAKGPSRPVRAGQAGQPGRSGGGRCHRRLEKDAGHGRHSRHHDQGGEPRAGRPWYRPHLRAAVTARFPGQHPVLGQSRRGHGADRPAPRYALRHRSYGHPAAERTARRRRSPGPTCRRWWSSPSARTR